MAVNAVLKIYTSGAALKAPCTVWVGLMELSTIGSGDRWQRTYGKYTFNGGDSYEVTNPANGKTKNLLTDQRSFAMAAHTFTTPGIYPIEGELKDEYGDLGAAEPIEVDIGGDDRGIRWIDPVNGDDGDNGLTEATAWRTYAFSFANVPTNCYLRAVDPDAIIPITAVQALPASRDHVIIDGGHYQVQANSGSTTIAIAIPAGWRETIIRNVRLDSTLPIVFGGDAGNRVGGIDVKGKNTSILECVLGSHRNFTVGLNTGLTGGNPGTAPVHVTCMLTRGTIINDCQNYCYITQATDNEVILDTDIGAGNEEHTIRLLSARHYRVAMQYLKLDQRGQQSKNCLRMQDVWGCTIWDSDMANGWVDFNYHSGAGYEGVIDLYCSSRYMQMNRCIHRSTTIPISFRPGARDSGIYNSLIRRSGQTTAIGMAVSSFPPGTRSVDDIDIWRNDFVHDQPPGGSLYMVGPSNSDYMPLNGIRCNENRWVIAGTYTGSHCIIFCNSITEFAECLRNVFPNTEIGNSNAYLKTKDNVTSAIATYNWAQMTAQADFTTSGREDMSISSFDAFTDFIPAPAATYPVTTSHAEQSAAAILDEDFNENIRNDTGDGYAGMADDPAVNDTTVPTAVLLSAPNIITAGGTTYVFTVRYTDSHSGVDISDLGNANITVTGPSAFSQGAVFQSVDVGSDGSPRTGTYQITPPGGAWNNADNGTYTITMNASQVSDVAGNFVVAGSLGTFSVNIPNKQKKIKIRR